MINSKSTSPPLPSSSSGSEKETSSGGSLSPRNRSTRTLSPSRAIHRALSPNHGNKTPSRKSKVIKKSNTQAVLESVPSEDSPSRHDSLFSPECFLGDLAESAHQTEMTPDLPPLSMLLSTTTAQEDAMTRKLRHVVQLLVGVESSKANAAEIIESLKEILDDFRHLLDRSEPHLPMDDAKEFLPKIAGLLALYVSQLNDQTLSNSTCANLAKGVAQIQVYRQKVITSRRPPSPSPSAPSSSSSSSSNSISTSSSTPSSSSSTPSSSSSPPPPLSPPSTSSIPISIPGRCNETSPRAGDDSNQLSRSPTSMEAEGWLESWKHEPVSAPERQIALLIFRSIFPFLSSPQARLVVSQNGVFPKNFRKPFAENLSTLIAFIAKIIQPLQSRPTVGSNNYASIPVVHQRQGPGDAASSASSSSAQKPRSGQPIPHISYRAISWSEIFHIYVCCYPPFSKLHHSVFLSLVNEALNQGGRDERLADSSSSVIDRAYIFAQMRRLQKFLCFRDHLRVDLHNSVLGLQISPHVLKSLASLDSRRGQEALPTKKTLLSLLLELSTVGDAKEVQQRVVQAASQIRQTLSSNGLKGELVLARFSHPGSGDTFHFARINRVPDSALPPEQQEYSLNINPREITSGIRIIKRNQLYLLDAGIEETLVGGDPLRISFLIWDPIDLLMSSASNFIEEAITAFLQSRGVPDLVMQIYHSRDLPSLAHLKLLQSALEQIQHPSLTTAPELREVDIRGEALLTDSIPFVNSNVYHPVFTDALHRLIAFKRAFSSTRVLQSIFTKLDSVCNTLNGKIQHYISMEAKKTLVDWWLIHIKQSTERFLNDIPLWTPPHPDEILGNKPARDAEALRRSSRIIAQVVDLSKDTYETRAFLVKCIKEVYVRIQEWLDEVPFVLASVLGVETEVSLLLLRESLAVYSHQLELHNSETSISMRNPELHKLFAIGKLHAAFKGFLANAGQLPVYQCYWKCFDYMGLHAGTEREKMRPLAKDIHDNHLNPRSDYYISLPEPIANSVSFLFHNAEWETPGNDAHLFSVIAPIYQFCEEELLNHLTTFSKSQFYAHYNRYRGAQASVIALENYTKYVTRRPERQLYMFTTESLPVVQGLMADWEYLTRIKTQDMNTVDMLSSETASLEAHKLGAPLETVPIGGLIMNRFYRYQVDIRSVAEMWQINLSESVVTKVTEEDEEWVG
ncbi:MAG: hypothetical protein Q8P67_12440 [archaeon]|nr:hypothetical protein [archaeon]